MTIREAFPYLRVRGAAEAIDFYTRVFGAKEKYRLVEPGGRIGHVELMFGDYLIMISEEFPEMDIHAPGKDTASYMSIHLHVDDADDVIERAIKAGSTLLRAPKDQFYGERSGAIRDPFGHEWMIGHSIEEVSPEEMQRRYSQA